MKELQRPLGGDDILDGMFLLMKLSFNASPTSTIFGKTNIC